MRILIVADIHSNWIALSAIQERFDACLVIGDIVDYGTDPNPCVDWCRQHATAAVRGNHDHAVAERVPARPGGGYRRLAAVARPLHWDVMDSARMRYLARLPLMRYIELDGMRFCLVHASPRDPLDEYVPDNPTSWEERIRDIEADVVCVGHSHLPRLHELGSRRVLNPGSVGQPRDGDPRASYAVIENGVIELKRVEYDIDAALEQMRQTPIADWAVRLSEQLWLSGGLLSRDAMNAIA